MDGRFTSFHSIPTADMFFRSRVSNILRGPESVPMSCHISSAKMLTCGRSASAEKVLLWKMWILLMLRFSISLYVMLPASVGIYPVVRLRSSSVGMVLPLWSSATLMIAVPDDAITSNSANWKPCVGCDGRDEHAHVSGFGREGKRNMCCQ